MKALIFIIFLSIFFTACFEEDTSPLNSDSSNSINGLKVIEDPFCQRLQIVDPPEVRKHELPLPLQPLKDFCSRLLFTRDSEFDDLQNVFACQISSETLENLEFQSYISDLSGEDLIPLFESQGNLHSLDDKLFIYFSFYGGRSTILWTIDQLWEQLSPRVSDLESLSWRLSFQHSTSVVCSPRAQWEVLPDQIFLHNLEICYQDGRAFNETYTFLPNGRLADLQQTPLEQSQQCASASFKE